MAYYKLAKRKRGRKPIGNRAMTAAERQARSRKRATDKASLDRAAGKVYSELLEHLIVGLEHLLAGAEKSDQQKDLDATISEIKELVALGRTEFDYYEKIFDPERPET